MQKAKQKQTKLIKEPLKKNKREEKKKQCAMVAFNPRFLECSKCYLPYKMSTTEKLHTLIHDNRLLQWLERKKKKILGFSLLCIIFSPFPWCVKKTNPTMEFYYCAYCCLCLSECIFSWLESQVLRAGSKKKKNEGIFCVI